MIDRRAFCNELIALYPPLEANPLEIETLPVGDHPSHTFPTLVKRVYRALARAKIILDNDKNLAAEEITWEGDQGILAGRLIENERGDTDWRPLTLGEMAEILPSYAQSIGEMPKRYPREGTALLAAFAIDYEWENRALAARLLPELQTIAPEVAVKLLTRLSEDPQDIEESRGIRSAARIGLKQLEETELRQEVPEIPYWWRPEWLSAEKEQWVSGAEIAQTLQLHGFGDRRVAGAINTLWGFAYNETQRDFIVDWRVAPGPVVRSRQRGNREERQCTVELRSLYAAITDNSHTGRAWLPCAVPVYPHPLPGETVHHECEFVIQQNLAALALATNVLLKPEMPLEEREPLDDPIYMDRILH